MTSWRFSIWWPWQIYFRFSVWWLTFKNVKSCSYAKLRRDTPIYGWDSITLGFRKQTAVIVKSRRFGAFHRRRYATLRRPSNFNANWMIGDGGMTSHQFTKMAATASQVYFRFSLWWRLTFKNSKNHVHTKFHRIVQSAAEILLFPCCRNKRPPYWNSTSGFHVDVSI